MTFLEAYGLTLLVGLGFLFLVGCIPKRKRKKRDKWWFI